MPRPELLELAKNYCRDSHLSVIPQLNAKLPGSLKKIYEPLWETDASSGGIAAPYETLTYLIDCYYCLPERPDLATLFCWQAINHAYNELILSDATLNNLSDSKGIKLLIDKLHTAWAAYSPYLSPFVQAIPDKAFRFVAAVMLRSYCAKQAGLDQKYIAKNYKGFLDTFPVLHDMLEHSVGPALIRVCTKPAEVVGNRVKINASEEDYLRIQRLFADKIMDLVKKQTTTYRRNGVTVSAVFSDRDVITLVIQYLLYSSRNNNLHGNVASRLNSNKANEQSYTLYTRLFLLEYTLLGIMLHMQGFLTDEALDRLKENHQLIC